MAAASSGVFDAPVVVLTGPTAAGKTEIAFRLADAWPVHLVSVDSVQVYRGMDIGSAKPSAEVLRRYPHALIDIRDPEQGYTAGEFVADAEREIRSAHERGRVPVLVGGTPMYLKALRYGLDRLPKADPGFREELERRARRLGWEALHAELAAVDPEAGRRIAPGDPQRIGRALEIHALTGRRPSELWSGRGADRLRRALHLVVSPADRAALHRRIDLRWAGMLEAGLLDEVEALLRRPGLDEDASALRAVGYRQALDLVRGRVDPERARERGSAATRQLAKRQLTALRQWTDARWYDPLNHRTFDRIIHTVGRYLQSSAARHG